jgi:hypothetical protein
VTTGDAHVPLNLRPFIDSAKDRTRWHFSNQVLYDLCRKHPLHKDRQVVLAKILLIGRAYAAAIERRKSYRNESNEDFYVRRVAPAIIRSPIDRWIEEAKRQKPGTTEAFKAMIEIHGRTTDLFGRISGLEKRALASKYLHFHVPGLFFIYDSRAVEAMRNVGEIVGRATHHQGHGDHAYATFAQKCMRLSQHFKADKLQPRDLDNVLLELSARSEA